MSEQGDMLGLPDDPNSLIGKDLSVVPSEKWAPLLADTLRVLESLYARKGYAAETAFRLAADSTVALSDLMGGRQLYYPRGDRLKIAIRDAEIFRRHRRGNIEALAKEYGLTVITIYKIIAQQHALHVRKVQGCLPFEKE